MTQECIDDVLSVALSEETKDIRVRGFFHSLHPEVLVCYSTIKASRETEGSPTDFDSETNALKYTLTKYKCIQHKR